jgi:hypothetical protein
MPLRNQRDGKINLAASGRHPHGGRYFEDFNGGRHFAPDDTSVAERRRPAFMKRPPGR